VDSNAVVFWDHGNGEPADVIVPRPISDDGVRRGDEATMRALAMRRPVKFGMVVVQPGITKGGLEPRMAEMLAAANYHLVRAGQEELEVWGNA
jgi:hypothetical protein